MEHSKAASAFSSALLDLYADIFGAIPAPKQMPGTGSFVRIPGPPLNSLLPTLIGRRRSVRSASGRPLALQEVLALLRDAAGLTETGPGGMKYAIPVAGGVRELKFFFFVRTPDDDHGCWEFIPEQSGAFKLLTPADFNPFIDSWERDGALSIIFGYPRSCGRNYANNLMHCCVEIGLISQNLNLLVLERFGRQCCMGGIVDVPAFMKTLGSAVLPLHSITVS
jgi:hypothetical protein